MEEKNKAPKILVFSTEKISDPAIDLAGLLKKHYPPTVYTIIVPCSSSIKKSWPFLGSYISISAFFLKNISSFP